MAQRRPPSDSSADFVIVGAGSSGCVLARRLSDDPDTSVVLLEAGGADRRREVRTPAAFPRLFKTEADWAYETEPQTELNNRRLFWPRGRMLGGTSSMNAMIYSRGNAADFDRWRELGNEGWSHADVLPYFKKSEDQERGSSAVHGLGGPLHVTDLACVNPLSRALITACVSLGMFQNDDFNGARQEGVGLFQVTQKNRQRLSAAGAYLTPVRDRPNLTVLTRARATRVLMEGTRATGVEYVKAGRTERCLARREVILSGGTVNSPQLLMLSGIGPADHLRSLDLTVASDLPGVGRHLKDHLAAVTTYWCTQSVTLARAQRLSSLLRYTLLRTGPLTSNLAEAGAFVRIDQTRTIPDLELLFVPAFMMGHGFLNPKGHGFSLAAVLQHPGSDGHLTLRSSSPLDPPAIQPNYLSDPRDGWLLREGVKLARRILQTRPFDPYRGDELWPGAEVRTDPEMDRFVRATAESLYHPVGTCRMGTDETAVVDPRFAVRGVERLRVVDASAMPDIITGHPNAVVIMMAEKAADLIRETR